MTDLFLVLHGLAIKKHGTAEEVASLMGLAVETVKAALDEAVAGGRVAEAQGKYMLTPVGRIGLESQYAQVFSSLRADATFRGHYDRFETINRDLKQLITDWQTMPVGGKLVPNDHSDKAYDDKIIDRLGTFHDSAELVLKGLAGGLARLAIYLSKLTAALEKAEDGDIAWVSDARTESYHTVWFELHEDLLRIMGTERDE
ncbi:MAG: hypothetical protein AAGF19_10120 [Pseudomonadota bacterium]